MAQPGNLRNIPGSGRWEGRPDLSNSAGDGKASAGTPVLLITIAQVFVHHVTLVHNTLRVESYYARSIASIMPGQTWRDTGHKALCPVSGPLIVVLVNLKVAN